MLFRSNDTATTEIYTRAYTLSLHDALPISTAELARQHNDANVISIGARQHSVEEAKLFIDTFINTPFSGEERHARRIAQLAEYETTGAIAGHQVD